MLKRKQISSLRGRIILAKPKNPTRQPAANYLNAPKKPAVN